MRIRWKRVGMALLAVAMLILWPRISALLRQASFSLPDVPDIVPCLCPDGADHDGVRAVLVLCVAGLCLVLVAREILQE